MVEGGLGEGPDSGDGLVVSRYGATLQLRLPSGAVVRATARRKLQHIVCGDHVAWQRSPTGDYAVIRILPRKNALVRSYFRGTPRTIAANIDQILVITAPRPAPDWGIVDGLLVAAELMPAEALILHHKADLETPPEMATRLAEYTQIGYPLLATTTLDPASITALEAALEDKVSILVGQSGMGKSSLANLLIPEAAAKTTEVSESSDLGQHTTSVTRLYPLPHGGALIDSPGIRDFTPPPLPPADYQKGFREFAELRHQCRFHNCLHHREPGCAVRAAVEAGKISPHRYANYLKLLGEAGR